MGSYLSEPVTEKVSTDEASDKLACGASSMQGWRVSQEDAHNCLLDFDEAAAFFAVYDGHGGHEVAHYCAQKLPEFLKGVDSYLKGEYTKALEEAFLGFDGTIATPEVIAVLKELASRKEADEDSEEEENVNHLYEEATMPIEKVIEKYTSNLQNPALKHLKDDKPVSPYLKAKKAETSSSSSEVSSSSTSNAASSASSAKSEETNCTTSTTEIPEIKVHSPDSSEDKNQCSSSSSSEEVTASSEEVTAKEDKHQNGVVNSEEGKEEGVTSSSALPQLENGEVTKKGKGKALTKTKGVKTPNVRPKRTVKQMYAKLLDFDQGSDDSEDEEDKTFEGPNDESSDDDDCLNPSIDDDEDDTSDEDDEDDDEEDDADEDDQADLEFARNMREEPGSDSGCTAVVALLKDNQLYVANAGDSRCIVCRNGQAVEMSFDHKPEDEPERDRVVKAGGKVTSDGRVNGGLNLSRAIGDHAYKQNKELNDREQMITALPDVRTLTINPSEDEFMVLACDGIWNFMSSQEVVDFVKPGIKEGKKLSKICEEMFDHCLAPNTMGDGTGCDNMTAIIVQFKHTLLKRSASPEPGESTNKKAKTETELQESAV